MKKSMIAFALLTVVSCAAVFAQELKFDGYFNSGVGIVSKGIEGEDPFIKAFGADSEQNGYRFRLNGSFTNEAKNAGVKFRFQSQSRLDQAGYFSLPYVYGWARFLNDIFYLAGGIVDDGTWQTADWWINDDVGEGLGMLLKAAPIKGLDLGIGAYLISQQSGGSNNILNAGGTAPNFADITPKLGDVKYVYSASYTMPEMFRLGATFRWKNKVGWDKSVGDYDKYDARDESAKLIGEFRFLAVKDLTAVIAANFDKIEDFENVGNIVLSETFGYKIDSLGIGLNAVQFLYNRDDVDYNPGLLFNLWGSYTIDKIVPRLDLVYFMGGQSNTAATADTWQRKGFANLAKTADAEDNYSVFSIRPSVKFNLDGKTSIEIGDMINVDMADKDGAYADSGDANKNSRLSNVFYIDLKWSF